MAAPEAAQGRRRPHTLSLFVANKPGVLVRVALVFARRNYNIESLVVSPAARGDFSRMTVTCSGDPATLEQIIKQLTKLVDVVHATDHTGDASYETEVALVKIVQPMDRRTETLQIAEHYGAKVVDYGPESLILRAYGGSEKLDAMIELLRPKGLTDLVRSGKILMARGLQET
ncbi:MAG: acetolactate synthase small subunit [Deltaproteobacteria bacterium]|nr:acetolactate synthase small subunit [Deltaproteobacteria bacterium]MDD9853844.1 acetolactate synthase small subunit [Deltaproteobacteria bacterium]MDD9872867.1 acetolactate synthase small subunit [Deltaproteobacteria bacterium]